MTRQPPPERTSYTMQLRRRGDYSQVAMISLTLAHCQLDQRAADFVEVLRTAAEFLTGIEWDEITLVNPAAA